MKKKGVEAESITKKFIGEQIEYVISNFLSEKSDKIFLKFLRGHKQYLFELANSTIELENFGEQDNETIPNVSADISAKAERLFADFFKSFQLKHPSFSIVLHKESYAKFRRAVTVILFKEVLDKPNHKRAGALKAKELLEDAAYLESTGKYAEVMKDDTAYLDKVISRNSDVANKNETTPNIYFKSILTHTQQRKLKDWISYFKYSPTPTAFIDLLTNKNAQVEINSEKLHHVSYLLHCLHNASPKLIELSHGKGIFKHFQHHIVRFSQIAGKRNLDDYKNEVIKKYRSKTEIINEVLKIMNDLHKK